MDKQRLLELAGITEAKYAGGPNEEQVLVARFALHGLYGLGVIDDGYDIFCQVADAEGLDHAIEEATTWNAVISFVNATLGENVDLLPVRDWALDYR